MSRKQRKVGKVFKVFCEGDTEYNYIDEMRRQLKLSIALKPINMRGGGYSSFLEDIRVDSNTNCVAKFIIIDGDRATCDVNEQNQLKKLLEYCIVQNISERTPHFLIVNTPDFEYIACLHVPSYRGKNVAKFIVDELGYGSVDEFKADSKVYNVLNTKGNSVKIMLDSLKRKNCFIVNKYFYDERKFSMTAETKYDWDKMGNRGSNINEFFEIVLGIHTKEKVKG